MNTSSFGYALRSFARIGGREASERDHLCQSLKLVQVEIAHGVVKASLRMSEQGRHGRQHPSREHYGVVIAPDAVRLTRVLPGPIERAWAFLTLSHKRATWLAAGEMELLMGGRVEHVFRVPDRADRKSAESEHWLFPGQMRMLGFVVACEPPHLLAYTWGGFFYLGGFGPAFSRLPHTRYTTDHLASMASCRCERCRSPEAGRAVRRVAIAHRGIR
jgi:hypothetical protein